jgi:hypothetical protein
MIDTLHFIVNVLWKRVQELQSEVYRYKKTVAAIKDLLDYTTCEVCELEERDQ